LLHNNYLNIPIDPAIATFWKDKFPDLEDLFEGDILHLTIAPESYRPVWGVASEVNQGYSTKFLTLASHRLEGFDLDLANECNCADVYYLLKDLEDVSKQAPCGAFTGIAVRDYLLPELDDIKAGREYSDRQVTIEVEATGGSMSLGQERSLFGIKVFFQILD
jgi:hypothetical protein